MLSSFSQGSITVTDSTLDITGQMSGGDITLNSATLMVGTGSPSVSGGSIMYGTGVDSVDLLTINSGANNFPQLLDMNDGDSIAESNIAFNSATWSANTLTLKENGTAVATFADVTLNPSHTSTIFTASTEVLPGPGGTTYYVATLDPPAGATGATGGHDPQTVVIRPQDLTSPHDKGHGPHFLYSLPRAATGTGTGTTDYDVRVRAGTDFVKNFDLARGDRLDLRQILAGAPLAHDLANLDRFVKVLGHGKNDPGFGPGTKTALEITGPHGTAVVNLEGVGKLDLADLLKHHSLLLPPQ